MKNKLQRNSAVVAGLVRALCRCCQEPQPLQPHARLDSAHLVCAETRLTYEDRGDGWFEQDGGELDATCVIEPVVASGEGDPGEPDLLSDRPARTGPKTRISLERATFARRAP